MPQKNQYKPRPPDDDIRGPLNCYYSLGLSDVEVVKLLKYHYDTAVYGLSVITLRRLRKQWSLLSTRQQHHTIDSIHNKVAEIRKRFPFRGAESIRKTLRQLYGDHIPRTLITRLLHMEEPDQVAQCRRHGFKRKRYWAAGVNDAWPQDQHDKWGRYGLWLHASIEAFSGEINWIKIWWTNKNPRLIVRYYLEICRKIGGVPIITQSDRGTENHGVANVHTLIRQRIDPTLNGTLQHRFTMGHNNILSEAKWSVFRRDFSPGFEDILEHGVMQGWYDPDDLLEKMIFRWLAIPWLQAEINSWVSFKNNTAPRAVRNKIRPQGIPSIIRAIPAHFHALDFKVPVTEDIFTEMEALYAPPNHPVFQLVPLLFHMRADNYYNDAGRPVVTSDTFWEVYCDILVRFRRGMIDAELDTILRTTSEQETVAFDDGIPVLPNMAPFRCGPVVMRQAHQEQYIGGLTPSGSTNGDAVDERKYADFTSDDDDENDNESGDDDW